MKVITERKVHVKECQEKKTADGEKYFIIDAVEAAIDDMSYPAAIQFLSNKPFKVGSVIEKFTFELRSFRKKGNNGTFFCNYSLMYEG